MTQETFTSDKVNQTPYEGNRIRCIICAVVLNIAKNYGISVDCVNLYLECAQPAGRNETFKSNDQTCILKLLVKIQRANGGHEGHSAEMIRFKLKQRNCIK